jgi:hypothetical protein
MRATDTTDFEREFADLVAQLRAVPTAAPEELRDRVRALGEPTPRASWSEGVRSLSLRRSLMVLAPVCVLAVVAAAVVHGVLDSAPPSRQTVSLSGAVVRGEAADKAGRAGLLPAPASGRLQDYEAWLTVRVADADALSDQANEAMRLARSLGGYVVSLDQTTAPGRPGQADLVLRIPVAHVQDALVQLGGLGTVLDRQLSIRDLQRAVQLQRERIVKLKLFIARATERLAGPLPADVRLRLQLDLEQARTDLVRATKANKATLREAALSRVELTLTTQKAVGAGVGHKDGRIERAARDAASFLAAAGAVALYVLIVLSPLLLIVGLAIWGSRAYRRREERRLLSAA